MKDKLVNGTCLGVTALATITQANEILQYIQLGLSILSTLVILIYNIYKWWLKAKQDGKITPDEVQEGVKIVTDGVEEIKNKTEGDNKNGKN